MCTKFVLHISTLFDLKDFSKNKIEPIEPKFNLYASKINKKKIIGNLIFL